METKGKDANFLLVVIFVKNEILKRGEYSQFVPKLGLYYHVVYRNKK